MNEVKLLFQGRGYRGSSRAGQLIAWILENDARINEMELTTVSFECNAQSVRVELRRRERIDPATMMDAKIEG